MSSEKPKTTFNLFDGVPFSLHAMWERHLKTTMALHGPDGFTARDIFNLRVMFYLGAGDLFKLSNQLGQLPDYVAIPILQGLKQEFETFFNEDRLVAEGQEAQARDTERALREVLAKTPSGSTFH